MSRYGKVERRLWVDAKFLRLSQDGKLLWLYLLTTDQATSLPGLLKLGKAQLAEALEWLPERLAKGFGELFREGMAKADWDVRVVWLPNAIRYNAPENPNVVKGWLSHWDLVPDCTLKDEAFLTYSEALKGLGEPFAKPFAERFRKGSGNRMPNQYQEQEQELEQEQERETAAVAATPPEVKEKKSRRRMPNVTIPDGWRPSEANYRKGLEARRFDRARVDVEAEYFRTKSVAKSWTYANWEMAFNNWLISEYTPNSRQTSLLDEPDPRAASDRRAAATVRHLEQRATGALKPREQAAEAREAAASLAALVGGIGRAL